MAGINKLGNVTAHCTGCGAVSSYVWANQKGEALGMFRWPEAVRHRYEERALYFVLFRCTGCGHGAIGEVVTELHGSFPERLVDLTSFMPEARNKLRLPGELPEGILKEFREAEECLRANCFRAASGMFRSALEKTLRAAGYKTKKGTTLQQMIDLAAGDRVITAARQRRAHEEVKTLGNDVLHEDWRPLTADDVALAHHYTQQIIDDFYDDRGSVLALLREAGRVPEEDRPPVEQDDEADAR